ncbi:molybdenum cofactor biosynthesis protein MoaE [Thermomonas sp.]|uniref:molybdenum cofactor biosynthesis protein MoaE n=1 Tax=Thermomonas sp. TaxID=1971895 RepID=UPI00248A37EA|nr:molybdenum cofactor biosynthesis protein MoaE [Thermomonas sp.]MDI1252145.1 molybdenum cofactor biosynthesis protein MoaE [Thermomonas sp.]
MDTHFVHVADRAQEAIDVAAALEFVSDPGFGGITMFVGRIRDLNHGHRVTGISYDMYRPLALARFAEIAAQATRDAGPALKLYIAHAVGRLEVGDVAVVVAAGTPHRDEAFRACRAAIEAVKHATPIWKQEHFEDGDSAWSEGCSLCDAPVAALPRSDVPASDVSAHEHGDCGGAHG